MGGIYAQIYNENGQKVGTEFQVNTSGEGHQAYPIVTNLANNKFIITYYSSGQMKSQVFDYLGNKIGNELDLDTEGDNLNFSTMRVDLLTENNEHLIVWWDGNEIKARNFDPNFNYENIQDDNLNEAPILIKSEEIIKLSSFDDGKIVYEIKATDPNNDPLFNSISGIEPNYGWVNFFTVVNENGDVLDFDSMRDQSGWLTSNAYLKAQLNGFENYGNGQGDSAIPRIKINVTDGEFTVSDTLIFEYISESLEITSPDNGSFSKISSSLDTVIYDADVMSTGLENYQIEFSLSG